MDLTPEQLAIRRVVCAAIRHPEGWIIIGPRHYDKVMHTAIEEASRGEAYRMEATDSRPYRDPWRNAEQGFIDQWGNFLTRREAWEIAYRQEQIIRLVGSQHGGYEPQDLYSENLY